jgi:hypothetical protein
MNGLTLAAVQPQRSQNSQGFDATMFSKTTNPAVAASDSPGLNSASDVLGCEGGKPSPSPCASGDQPKPKPLYNKRAIFLLAKMTKLSLAAVLTHPQLFSS